MSVDKAYQIVAEAGNLNLNEADTRFRVIDKIIEDVLCWPRVAFSLEHNTSTGYADYVLRQPSGPAILVIEAKRSGVYFDLPENFNSGKLFRTVKIRTLQSGSLGAALEQAKSYALELGCEFGAVSNGRQFIFFKVFERGRAWKDLGAVVISDISWFSTCYSAAVKHFGYSSVTERSSLSALFRGQANGLREVFYPKEKINAFSQLLNQNILAATLRPLARKYFGSLTEHESSIIQSCYVNQRAYDLNLRGVRTLIADSVTPFFQTYGVVEVEESERGGSVAKRIQRSVQQKRGGDVIVLFGGKGAGKSTFLWRVLHYNPPQFIKKHVKVATVNMLSVPTDTDAVRNSIWQEIVTQFDTENLLGGDRSGLIRLFEDKWSIAERQDLFGLDHGGEEFNKEANRLLISWKADLRYVASRLAKWHQARHRGCVVVLDNTDQFENILQDYSFTVAQEVSVELGCLVLISMREERFYASKMRGLLDAYQNSAFHISSPPSATVFVKRLEFLISELKQGRVEVSEENRDQLVKFLGVFLVDFKRTPDSPLNRFISACAHGNIRLALDLFVDLLLSGYTNAREMVQQEDVWTVQIHQVLRPLMTPTRLFYDEKMSKVVNIYQVRSPGGSHFTGLRILSLLSSGQDPTSPGFVPFGEVRNRFILNFGSEDDFRVWIDVFLSKNLVEASTRQDAYSEDIDALRVTAYGQFFLREAKSFFTYIELVATDVGVRDEGICNQLVVLTNEEVTLMNERKKLERVKKRLEKAEAFISYLEKEEQEELEYLGIADSPVFIPEVRRAFLDEREGVLRSARRKRNR